MSKLYNEIMALVAGMRARGFVKEAQALEGSAFEYNLALSDMLGFAHPEGDAHVMNAQMGLGDFETLGSAQKKMLEVALKQPGMSRMAKLAGLVKKGQEERQESDLVGEIGAARQALLNYLEPANFRFSQSAWGERALTNHIFVTLVGEDKIINYNAIVQNLKTATEQYSAMKAEYDSALFYQTKEEHARLIEKLNEIKNLKTEQANSFNNLFAIANAEIDKQVKAISDSINTYLSDDKLSDSNNIYAGSIMLSRLSIDSIKTSSLSAQTEAAKNALINLKQIVKKYSWWQPTVTADRYLRAARVFEQYYKDDPAAQENIKVLRELANLIIGGQIVEAGNKIGVTNKSDPRYEIDQDSIATLTAARGMIPKKSSKKNNIEKLALELKQPGAQPAVKSDPATAPAARPAAGPVVRPAGNKPAQDAMGPAIQKMQEALITFLKDGPARVGEPDGRWGPKTNDALKEAQRSLPSGALQMRAPYGNLPALGVKNITPQQQQQFAAAAAANTAAMAAAPKKAKVEYDTVGGVSFNSWNMSGLNYFIRLLQTNMPNLNGITAEAGVKKNLTKNAQSADDQRTQTYVRDPHTGKMTQEHLVKRNREKLEESAEQAHDTVAENALFTSPSAQSQQANLTYGEVDRVLRTLIQRAERMSADAMNDTGEVPAKLYEYENRAKKLLTALHERMRGGNFASNTPVTTRPSDSTQSGNKDDGYAKERGRGRGRNQSGRQTRGDDGTDQPDSDKWDEKPFGSSSYRPQPLRLVALGNRTTVWQSRKPVDSGLIDQLDDELYSELLRFETLSNPNSILSSVLDAGILQSLIAEANSSLNNERPNSQAWNTALLKLSAYYYVADYCSKAGRLIYAIREAYMSKPNADEKQSEIADMWLGALNRAYNDAMGRAQKGMGRSEVQPRSSQPQRGVTTDDARRHPTEQQGPAATERRLYDATRGRTPAVRPAAGRFGRPGVVPNR